MQPRELAYNELMMASVWLGADDRKSHDRFLRAVDNMLAVERERCVTVCRTALDEMELSDHRMSARPQMELAVELCVIKISQLT